MDMGSSADVRVHSVLTPIIISAQISLEELHSVATQNLIASTQECIVRQLNSCPEIESPGQDQAIDDTTAEGLSENEENSSEFSEREENTSGSKKKPKNLICPHKGCGKKFRWPSHFRYHQLTHSGQRQYSCLFDGCGQHFYTTQRLAIHMRTHTGERPFTCPREDCKKSFTTAGNLRNHMRIHSGEKPFSCTISGCNSKFAEYSSLKKHLVRHSGEKPFVCDICGKAFSQSGSRNVHRKRYHETSVDSPSLQHDLQSGTLTTLNNAIPIE